MKSRRGSADTWFTILIAFCTIAVTGVFIAAGSAVAKLTFTPHVEHGAAETH